MIHDASACTYVYEVGFMEETKATLHLTLHARVFAATEEGAAAKIVRAPFYDTLLPKSVTKICVRM